MNKRNKDRCANQKGNVTMLYRGMCFISLLLLVTLSVGCSCDEDEKEKKCEPGTAGCACIDGSTCDDGLICVDGLCKGESSTGISVSDSDARSCEVLLVDNNAEVARVDFGENVKGTYVREAPRTAVTFLSLNNEAIGSGQIDVRFVKTQEGGNFEVSSATCFDAQGQQLDGAEVTIND